MTCRFLDGVLLLDSVRFEPAEAAAIEAHAAGCAECSPVLERLRAARAVQLSQVAAIPPDARVVVWAGLEAKSPRAPMVLGVRAIAGLAAFATAAVVWLVFHREPVPETSPMVAVEEVVEEIAPVDDAVAIARGRVRAGPGALWSASDDGVMVTIRLEQGAIDVELDPAATAEIVTVDARVRVFGGRATVGRIAESTDIRANKGTLEVSARGLRAPVSLSEGQQLVVPVAPKEKQSSVQKRPRRDPKIGELDKTPEIERDPADAPKTAQERNASNRADSTPEIERTPADAPKTARNVGTADAPNRADETPEIERSPADAPKTARDAAVEELKTARKVIDTDAPRAAEIAERVLSRGAPAELEADAIAVLADAERRRGRLGPAAILYAKLRDHPRGRGYAEEAMLQRALLLEQLRNLDAALAELTKLESLHPRGVSAPERAALAAKIHLAKDDPRKAAQVILDVRFQGRSRALENRRIEVARALEKIDPPLAKKLMASRIAGDHSSEANR